MTERTIERYHPAPGYARNCVTVDTLSLAEREEVSLAMNKTMKLALVGTTLAFLLAVGAPVASAGGVGISIGIPLPGVAIYAPPVYAPPPVYYSDPYYYPRPHYPHAYYAPRGYYYGPSYGRAYFGHGGGWRHGHRHHHGGGHRGGHRQRHR